MSRFFVEKSQIDPEGAVIIKGTDVNHMQNVLRMKPGDSFTACDSTGMEYNCVLESFSENEARGAIISCKKGDTEPRTPCTLLQGIPKGDKMELIIQKNIELGVNRIIPVIMERTVVKFKDQKDIDKKTERWNRIAMEAAKQCGRLAVPEVARPVSLKEAIDILEGEQCQNMLKLAPYENERDIRLKDILRGRDSESTLQAIAFLIGPEGGISEAEMELLNEAGFIPVSLGKRILRTETAGFAVMAAIRYELED